MAAEPFLDRRLPRAVHQVGLVFLVHLLGVFAAKVVGFTCAICGDGCAPDGVALQQQAIDRDVR